MALSKREYEEYKMALDKMVSKYIGRDRTSVVSTIVHAIDSGYEKHKLEDKLLNYVDKTVAYKLTDKAYMTLENLGIKLSSLKKRSYKDDGSKNRDAKRSRTEREDLKPIERSAKVIADFVNSIKNDEANANFSSLVEQPPAPPPPTVMLKETTSHLQPDQIKMMMAKAQATIEERKKTLLNKTQNFIPAPPPPLLPQPPPPIQIQNTTGPIPLMSIPPPTLAIPNDLNFKIAQLQSRIQSQMGNAGLQSASSTPSADSSKTSNEAKPTPLILDAEGRTIDVSGKEVHLTQMVPTLKANIRAKKREEFKQQLLEKPSEEPHESDYFDGRVVSKPFSRTPKAFKFHEQGKYIHLAKRERAKARLEKLQEEISQVAKKTGISSAAKLAQLEQKDARLSASAYTIIEWWDAIILENDNYPDEGAPVKVKDDFITSLVEHPMETKGPNDLTKPAELQVFLTKKERKKLRRMNRREAWKEKVEKIRLGLEPPPEPKVRMANLMRVLGTEAVLDPTKMEKHVRQQMAKRLKAHEDANKARKLTPEQRREKKMRKIKEDTTGGVTVAIYRVTDMTSGSHKFKVETNAKQLFMTGTVVLYKDVNVVVVEGGPKQQKKYKRLMMDRIKWAEGSRNKDSDIEAKCQLVWEGNVPDRNFGELQFKSCPSDTFARDHFRKHGVEHYWDLAFGKKILEETEEHS